jgi:cell fate (sporulation/competence/biofilm development) regulator YlbF (YheA/YmcA/DUF963 family)
MFVPSYQMHNVLNVYSKKLRHNITTKDQKASEESASDRVNSNSEAKRRATIEKVSKDIFDKIIRFGSQIDSSHQKSEKMTRKLDKETASTHKSKAGFVFNVIDAINKKTTNTVSVEDSNFLIQRLEQLSKETMEMKKRNDKLDDRGEIDSPIP